MQCYSKIQDIKIILEWIFMGLTESPQLKLLATYRGMDCK